MVESSNVRKLVGNSDEVANMNRTMVNGEGSAV